MSWIGNVWADVPNLVVSKPLIENSPMFSAWESVGGVQRRITFEVPEADDADAARETAETEIKQLLGEQLSGIAESAATQVDDD